MYARSSSLVIELNSVPVSEVEDDAAKALTGITAIIDVRSIITVKAVDIIFFIFICTSCYIRFPISEIMVTINIIILTTRLEKSMTTNIITAIATIVPRMVTKFFPSE